MGSQGVCRQARSTYSETGGTTGIPKSRIAVEDFRIDYSMFSDTLPDDSFRRVETG